MPAWLEKAVTPTLIPGLRHAIKWEADYPSRPELYARLKAIENAARLLIRELPKLHILDLLLEGDTRIVNENETYHGLHDIATRSARVRANKPPKQGRGKLAPDAGRGPNA